MKEEMIRAKKELKELAESIKENKRGLKLEAKHEQEFLKGRFETKLKTTMSNNNKIREEIKRQTETTRTNLAQLEDLRRKFSLSYAD